MKLGEKPYFNLQQYIQSKCAETLFYEVEIESKIEILFRFLVLDITCKNL